jgi:uncharacterized coiled-coil protein SlyX
MSELKPCPFCGGEAVQDTYHGDIRVRCLGCSVQHLNPEALKTWNTRADQWQPTETAPKDGELIILFADVPWRIRIGYRDSGSGKFHSIPQSSTLRDQPTHWMPLPSPPHKESERFFLRRVRVMNITKLPDRWRDAAQRVNLRGQIFDTCATELEAALADQWQPLEELQKQLEHAEKKLKRVLEWLDNNTTHYETATQDKPVLAEVSKKIWYHATDDCESYPFSEMMQASMKE